MNAKGPIGDKAILEMDSCQGWGAVSDFSLISVLSQKFKHDLWRVKSVVKLSQKQHLTPAGLSHNPTSPVWRRGRNIP